MKILIAATATALRAALTGLDRSATVEAEYGDELVEGSVLTLAHHGSRSDNPPPCVGGNWDLLGPTALCGGCGGHFRGERAAEMASVPCECGGSFEYSGGLEAIGLSHIDLDTLGGVMRLLGKKASGELPDAFWAVAGQVDVRGPHHLGEILEESIPLPWVDPGEGRGDGAFEFTMCYSLRNEVRRRLQAFWAWSESHRVFAPRDGSSADVTAEVTEAVEVLGVILDEDTDDDHPLFKAGEQWAAEKSALEQSSFVRAVSHEGGPVVLLRSSEKFTNHLYGHAGRVAAGVVAYNPARGTVTLSLADPVEGVSCCEIAQQLWGPEAGGHAGIAGSPREGGLSLADAECAAVALAAALMR